MTDNPNLNNPEVNDLNATSQIKFDLVNGVITSAKDIIAGGNSLADLAAKVATLLAQSKPPITSDKIAAGSVHNVHLGNATLDSVGDGLSRLLFSPFVAIYFPNAVVNTNGTIQVANPILGSISESQFITSQDNYAGTFVLDVAWFSIGILYVAIFASTDTGYIWEFNNLAGAQEVRIWRIDTGTLTEITNNNLSGTQLNGMPGNLGANLPAAWQHCSIEYDATGAMRVHVGAKLMATANDNTYVIGGPLGYGYGGSTECVIANPQISTAANDTPMPDPLNLAYAITSHNDIKLTWNFPTAVIPQPKPPREFDHFEIRVNSTNTFAGSTYIDQTRKHQYLIVDPASGSNYYFVAALNKAGYYDNSPPSVLVAYTQQPYTVKTLLASNASPTTALNPNAIISLVYTIPPAGGRLHIDWTMVLVNGSTTQVVAGKARDTTNGIDCALHKSPAIGADFIHAFNASGHFNHLYNGGDTPTIELQLEVAADGMTVYATDIGYPDIHTFLDIQFHPSPN